MHLFENKQSHYENKQVNMVNTFQNKLEEVLTENSKLKEAINSKSEEILNMSQLTNQMQIVLTENQILRNLMNQKSDSSNSFGNLENQIKKLIQENKLLIEENKLLHEKLLNSNLALNKQREFEETINFLSNENLKLNEQLNIQRVDLEQANRMAREKQDLIA